jgi:hypothetical protein
MRNPVWPSRLAVSAAGFLALSNRADWPEEVKKPKLFVGETLLLLC